MTDLDKELHEAQRIQYGMWLGLPKSSRLEDEKTEDAYSKKICISLKTLNKWKKEPFVKKIAENALKFYGEGKNKEIIDKLRDEALSGSVPAMKLWMEWQGFFASKKAKVPGSFNFELETDE